MELQDALSDAKAALADAEAQLQELSIVVEELRTERRGLEHAVARHTGSRHDDSAPAGEQASPPPANHWVEMSRTDAILSVLGERDEAMSPSELTRQLRARGRTDKPHAVGAALSYLRSRNRVHAVGRGHWRPGSEDPGRESSGSTTFVLSDDTQTNGSQAAQQEVTVP